ncbi:hypothetical protein IFM89_013608 [Coptis chinensis]|uniref:Heat shock protein 70 n=1 Tax=Coptis chinensis TaxID=261450 RepID=A0A835IQR0_9MAGN|nr:hypothetical protein IFM89_013608 [Coptis chinensis]
MANIKQTAESYIGKSVSKAFVTFPLWFTDEQVCVIMNAGRMAGLAQKGFQQPIAAAISYGLLNKEGLFAVVDLGGTFDASVLKISNGTFDIKGRSTDKYLGGEDFDIALLVYLVSDFKRAEAIDLTKIKLALGRLTCVKQLRMQK